MSRRLDKCLDILATACKSRYVLISIFGKTQDFVSTSLSILTRLNFMQQNSIEKGMNPTVLLPAIYKF